MASASLTAQDSIAYKSLNEFLKSGKVSGKSRFYYMQSDNAKPLTDYHGLGIGAGIGYETPDYKGFSAGMSGYFIMNAWSSDFTEPDSVTQNPNRYELGLFDVTDPGNTSDLYRLENLWVKFEKKNTQIIAGQYVPDYLFINPQDGRMSPTLVRGMDFRTGLKGTKLMLTYLQGLSPRSTVKWYSVGETFGIYPSGRATDGSASSYAGNISTSGILLAELNLKKGNWHAQNGSMTVLDVFQTWYSDVHFKQNGWDLGLMGIYQYKINKNLNTSYIDADHQSIIISTRIQKKLKDWTLNANYSRITANGRFLMPREWGREPLYTFLPRERNEGTADTHAASFNVTRKLSKAFTFHLGAGRYWLPDPANAAKNKYAMPSYNQINMDLDYQFSGWLEGAAAKLLFVRKDALEDTIENQKIIFNKVDLTLLNLIINYHF